MALNDALVRFVKDGLERGLPRDRIADALLRAGWPPDQVSTAMRSFAEIDFPIPVPRPMPNVSARDAFMYVVMFATLVLALSLGDLTSTSSTARSRSCRDHVSAADPGRDPLVARVADRLVPDFSRRRLADGPRGRGRSDQGPRRSAAVTYVTLAIAACALVGDVISLIYNFLGGELTARFLLKVLTVALIAGTAFVYYLWDLRETEKEPET